MLNNQTYIVFAALPGTPATERQGDSLVYMAASNEPETALSLARDSQRYSDSYRITSIIIVAAGHNRLFDPIEFSGHNMVPTELIMFEIRFTEGTSQEMFLDVEFRKRAAPTDAERREVESVDRAIDGH